MSSEPELDTVDSLRIAADVANLRVTDFRLPEEHHVVLGGMRFHYLDWGGQGRPILWLHGGALTAHTYDLVCLAMRHRYRCVALDQRGHGDSEWSPVLDYGHRTHAGDVAALVDALGWDRFLLVGMSMGGINAIAYASAASHRLAGLVLIDIGPETQPIGAARIRDFTSAEGLDSVDDYVARAMRFNPRRNPRLLRRSLLHNLRQGPDGRWIWKWDPRPREEPGWADADPIARQRRAEALWADVDTIDSPTLVVRGAESDLFLDEDAERLAARLKDGRWAKVPSAGHTVQGDNPGGLLEAMDRFLAEIEY